MTHGQQSVVERIYHNRLESFWDRHQWLDNVVSQRTQIYSLHYPDGGGQEDPLLLFVGMMAKVSVLDLCRTMESVPWDMEARQLTGMTYKARALTAAQEMVRLVKALGHLNCFMVCCIAHLDDFPVAFANYHQAHPFTAVALASLCKFLTKSKGEDSTSGAGYQDVLSALKDLKSVNNLAAHYLRLYE